MAFSKVLIISLIFFLLVLNLVEADETAIGNEGEGSPKNKSIECGGSCAARCQLSSRPRLCKRACGTCCRRCNCVPPGTAGNLEVCPCYANMTTHGGRRKCP
ncbi:gibberellin-regulated protein 1 [Humulus lupulus]|uniref:gibberellin-regulated protein 1 n=1 Tax=Humulus lupulus TaxID=3486 RepID=UPI002B417CF7|nr:gibberellin-regulated protein 1 [Humulus lupulus]